jgi:outer membrane lipoprotein-sorting protein
MFQALIGLLILLSGDHSNAAPSPEKILEEADRARGGLASGLEWTIQVQSVQDDSKNTATYEVKAKDVNVIAKCIEPPRQKGETFLFNDRNLWIYRPGLRKPVSISTRQRLTGQAANGDIATTNYARDYDANIEGEDKVNGVATYKLMLKAKKKDVTYDGIRYWVSKDKLLGLKAEFLTLDGKVFKRATIEYKNEIAVGPKKTPFVSKMIISDATFEKNVTTLTYEKPKPASFNDTIFNVNNLAR